MRCLCREQCLRQQGFSDVFRDVKAEENKKALALLPAVLRQGPLHILLSVTDVEDILSVQKSVGHNGAQSEMEWLASAMVLSAVLGASQGVGCHTGSQQAPGAASEGRLCRQHLRPWRCQLCQSVQVQRGRCSASCKSGNAFGGFDPLTGLLMQHS